MKRFTRFGSRRPFGKLATPALRLNQLETRACPSITAVLAAGTLTITGNGGSDHVFVTQTDDGDIRVQGNNGNLTKTFDGNSVIVLQANLGAGFNLLDIDLTVSNGADFDHEGFDQNPIIRVTSGNDSDTITVNLGDDAGGGGGGNGDDDGRGDVSMSFNTAGGNDRVSIIAGADFGGTFDLSAVLGSGNDSISCDLDGDLDGDATVHYDLGTGNDTSSFTCEGDVKSNFEYTLIGNSGNDYNSLDIGGTISGDAIIDANLGTGNDYFSTSVGGDTSGLFEYTVDAGTGNDNASLDIGGNQDGEFVASVNMGSSNDTFTFNLAGDSNGGHTMEFETESGNDSVSLTYGGDINGPLSITGHLGSGNDYQEVTVSGNIVNDEEVFMDFNGSTGYDTTVYTFGVGELEDIDFSSILFENETYNEGTGGSGGILPDSGPTISGNTFGGPGRINSPMVP